jgi:putative membrane protein
MTIHDLPAINAALNGLSTVFISTGWYFIRRDRKQAHIAMMIAALITSGLFLACYLYYHFNVHYVTRFTATGLIRPIYFFILITHVLLAFLILPMVILTLVPALRARWDKHRRIGRWTMPLWLYVSVTGVLVYLILYIWFPPAPATAPVL